MNLTDLESQVQELRFEIRAMLARLDRLDECHPVNESRLIDLAQDVEALNDDYRNLRDIVAKLPGPE